VSARGQPIEPAGGAAAGMREFTLAFSASEFQRRLSAVRRAMERQGLELLTLFTPENVTYLTGYETVGYSSFLCLLVPASGEPRMVIRELEVEVAAASTWLTEFTTVADTESPVAITAGVAAQMAPAGARVGVEETGKFLTARNWRALVGELTDAGLQAVDGSDIVEPVRRVKSPEELTLIRGACDLAVAGMHAAVEAVDAGVTENTIAAVAFAAMIGGGSDFLTTDPIVTSGPRASIAHTTFANRTIEPRDAVLIELGACRRRYFGALMRTVGVDGGPHRLPELATALDAALDAAIAAIAPGRTCGEVDHACRSRIEEAGLGDWFRKRTGYSIGIAFAPDWGEGHIASLRAGDSMELEAGMTFHIPPAVRLPGETVYGVSETVVVTPDGCEVLTAFPRRLT
jgi:Xaa-Pro dipeptidase